MLKRNEDGFVSLLSSFFNIVECITDSRVSESTIVFDDCAFVYYPEGGFVYKYEKKTSVIPERK